jgi:hypothetical protein
MAFDCFNNLLSDFTSRENYNNAAVCKMQLALNLFEPYEMPFHFPFELDYETRITGSSNRSGAPRTEEKRKAYLVDARKLLDESIRRDPNYSKGKINLAICYVMLDNPDMASGILKEIALDTTIERRILSSIIMAKKGHFTEALNELSSTPMDITLSSIITSNKTLYKVALERKLNIGDDELGYQLRKSNSNHPSLVDGQNSTVVDCLEHKSKKIDVVSDSIRVSDNTSILMLKGNGEFAKAIILRSKIEDKQIGFYQFRESNDLCGFSSNEIAQNIASQFLRNFRVIRNQRNGVAHFLYVSLTNSH